MTRDQARSTIVSEWLALDPRLRQTEKELLQFAAAAKERHRFPADAKAEEVIADRLRQAQLTAAS